MAAPSPFDPIPLFAVPLYTSIVDGHERYQAALIQEILEHKKQDPTGDVRSNRGTAWHSGPEFQESRSEALAWLLQSVTRFARIALAPHYDNWSSRARRMGSYWANVLGRHGFNAPHHHMPEVWSGVYYVQVGPLGEGHLGEDRRDFSGWIEFLNPNLSHSAWGQGNFAQKPKDGMVLLFPSSQLHYVNPVKVKSQRITVAFNFDVVQTT